MVRDKDCGKNGGFEVSRTGKNCNTLVKEKNGVSMVKEKLARDLPGNAPRNATETQGEWNGTMT